MNVVQSECLVVIDLHDFDRVWRGMVMGLGWVILRVELRPSVVINVLGGL